MRTGSAGSAAMRLNLSIKDEFAFFQDIAPFLKPVGLSQYCITLRTAIASLALPNGAFNVVVFFPPIGTPLQQWPAVLYSTALRFLSQDSSGRSH